MTNNKSSNEWFSQNINNMQQQRDFTKMEHQINHNSVDFIKILNGNVRHVPDSSNLMPSSQSSANNTFNNNLHLDDRIIDTSPKHVPFNSNQSSQTPNERPQVQTPTNDPAREPETTTKNE